MNGDFPAAVPPEPTEEELAQEPTVAPDASNIFVNDDGTVNTTNVTVLPGGFGVIHSAESAANDDDEDENDDELFTEAESFLPDGASFVTLRTSTGKTFHTPVPEGETRTARELVASAQLKAGFDLEIWLDGAQITLDTPVPAGRTLTLIGSVKGG
jgi:hypothetical protein